MIEVIGIVIFVGSLVLLWRCVWLVRRSLRTGVGFGTFGSYERDERPLPFWIVIASNAALAVLCCVLIWAFVRDFVQAQ